MEEIKNIKFVIRCMSRTPEVVIVDTRQHPIIKIGNDPRSQLKLDSDFVSRMHAIIEVSGEKATFIDLGSAEGALINGKGIAKEQLFERDLISIGPFRIRVYFNQTSLDISEEDSKERSSSAESVATTIHHLVFVVRRDNEVVKILRSEVPYGGGNLILGCGNTVSPLSLDDAPGVGELHALIRRNADGRLSLLDLRTVSGTRLNEAPVSASDLKCYDVIGIGPYSIQVLINPEESCIPVVGATPEQTIGFLIQRGAYVEKRVFPVHLAPGSNVFGLTISRDSDADIRLEGTDMVGVRAFVCFYDDAFSFKNVGKVFPTTLNDVVFDQHMQSSPLKDGDVIGAGDYRIQVFINPKKEDFEKLQELKEEPNAEPEDLATENARLKRELADALRENRELRSLLDIFKSSPLRALLGPVPPSITQAFGDVKRDLDGLITGLRRFVEPESSKKPKE